MNSGAGRSWWRMLISLIGAALIFQAASSVALGIAGERATAVITHTRRELGERDESIPNRYTYIVSYAFKTADGQAVSGFTRRVGSAVYLKASGQPQAEVRYLKPFPAVNALEADARLSWGSVVLMAAGGFLIFAVNKPQFSIKHARKLRRKPSRVEADLTI